MENPNDEEIVRKWQAREVAQRDASGDSGPSRKRPRKAIENGSAAASIDLSTASFITSIISRSRDSRRSTTKKSAAHTTRSVELLSSGVDEGT
jgi:hypothetical protein